MEERITKTDMKSLGTKKIEPDSSVTTVKKILLRLPIGIHTREEFMPKGRTLGNTQRLLKPTDALIVGKHLQL